MLFRLFKKYVPVLLGIDEGSINRDPVVEFERWFNDARKARLPFPEAMTLSTATPDGKPSARLVLLKSFDKNGFVFFTNYRSRKAQEIARNPWGALTFYWAELNRQVRIDGKIEKISPERSDAYFNTRNRGSQIGAWASPQSSVITGRKFIDEKTAHYKEKFKAIDVPRPPHWGGFCLCPGQIQFWQARADRLHDRFLFTMQNDGIWKMERLAP